MQVDISQVFQAAKCCEGGEGEQKAALQNITDSWQNPGLRDDPCVSASLVDLWDAATKLQPQIFHRVCRFNVGELVCLFVLQGQCVKKKKKDLAKASFHLLSLSIRVSISV